MHTFDISAYLGSSITIGNALGLAIDPNNGNIFLTTLSDAGEPNLWQFTTSGQLVQQSRVAINLLSVPGAPGELLSATVGQNGRLFISVAKPISQTVTTFSVAEVSQDGATVYSSFPDFIFTRGGSGMSYASTRQNLLLSSFADKTVYEVNLQGVLADRFEILAPAADIAYDPSNDSVFVASGSFLGGALIEYKKDVAGKYSRINVYSLQPLGLSTLLAFEINRNTGLFYIQDNNVRVVEFRKSELTAVQVPDISGTIAVQGLPPANCVVTLQQVLQPDQNTQTNNRGAYSFNQAAEGVPFKVVIEGL